VRIYFAGSIRGGRDDARLYQRLVATLGQYGQVLTEHVAATDATGELLSDREIHDRDLGWLRSADVVVAEATVPSLGVGYEIAQALALRKPVLVLFRPSAHPAARLSAMVAGAPEVTVLEYADLGELEAPLQGFFERW
jgi:nucleoside 2-deoxyribosyltransferase